MDQVGGVMGRDFPGAQSVWDTLVVNPTGVLIHSLRNVVETPHQVLPGLAFDRWGSLARNAIAATVLLCLLRALLFVLLRRGGSTRV